MSMVEKLTHVPELKLAVENVDDLGDELLEGATKCAKHTQRKTQLTFDGQLTKQNTTDYWNTTT